MDKKSNTGKLIGGIAVAVIIAGTAFYFYRKKEGAPASAESGGSGGGGGGGAPLPSTGLHPSQVIQYQPPVVVIETPTRYLRTPRRFNHIAPRTLPTPVTVNGQLTVPGTTATIGANPNAPVFNDAGTKDPMVTSF